MDQRDAIRYYVLIFQHRHAHRAQHSFPTRRSSDLQAGQAGQVDVEHGDIGLLLEYQLERALAVPRLADELKSLDRKSTRLNSSHVAISYAVFCLKKTTAAARNIWSGLTRIL